MSMLRRVWLSWSITGRFQPFVSGLLLLVLGSASGLANEFVVESFEKAEKDLSARVHERKDVNDDPCALIKIRTDIPKPFVFDSNLGIEGDVEYGENNEIWIYVSAGERQLTIAKEGFVTLNYAISGGVDSWDVFVMVVKAKDNKLPVVIISEPGDAEKWVDGENLGGGENFDLEIGERQLVLRKEGFRTLERTILVEEGNLLFRDLVMEQIDVVPVNIASNPEGAQVYINGELRGESPWTDFLFPGSYDLKIIKSGYLDYTDSMEVRDQETNSLSYTLTKNKASLVLRISPPNASVAINRKDYGVERNFELAPGRYQVEVTSDYHFPQKVNVEIQRGSPTELSIDLKPYMGSLQFTVTPGDAQATLKRSNGQVFDTWQGIKLIPNLPAGPYVLEARHPDYLPQQREIMVEHEKRLEVNLQLLTYSGSVQQEVAKQRWKRNLTGLSTVLLGGAAFVLKSQTDALYADYQASRLPDEAENLYKDASNSNTLAQVTGLAAGAMLGVTLYYQVDIGKLQAKLGRGQ